MDKAQLLVEKITFYTGASDEYTTYYPFTNIFYSHGINLLPAPILYMVIWVMTADDELFTSTSSSNTKTTPNPVLEMPPILPNVEMTPVDQTVIPETSQKKDK
ncbi:hypothetical protein RhiirC2_804419 [Rhizophagus irregularis]|uniref:Uncharacterized protein n=1 Tax=Rhizophagus irregularis TaxID=588596 RepID=A0A2N1L055_9GLOM|nr:hypothetical protein RhiirC2_804419 [Rhizophagus irregularis]